MRPIRRLAAFAIAGLLSACLPTGEAPGPSLAPAPVTVEVLSEPPPAPEPVAAVDPPATAAAPEAVAQPPDAATAACVARGGSMSAGPAGIGRICVMPTPDAGRRCDRAGDCTGYCLARSRSCAPVTPLLGCHEVLMSDGRRMNQCIQ